LFRHSKPYVSGLDDKCIQPNAVDIRLSKLSIIIGGEFVLENDGATTHLDKLEVNPVPDGDGRLFYGLTEHYYDFLSEHSVSVPPGMIGWVVPRSSLIRNGMFLKSGLYDAGYRGSIGGQLMVSDPYQARSIEKGARIGQFVMVDAETYHSYNGQYQGM
jgi:deoxycytidine triphosphate deaminase